MHEAASNGAPIYSRTAVRCLDLWLSSVCDLMAGWLNQRSEATSHRRVVFTEQCDATRNCEYRTKSFVFFHNLNITLHKRTHGKKREN